MCSIRCLGVRIPALPWQVQQTLLRSNHSGHTASVAGLEARSGSAGWKSHFNWATDSSPIRWWNTVYLSGSWWEVNVRSFVKNPPRAWCWVEWSLSQEARHLVWIQALLYWQCDPSSFSICKICSHLLVLLGGLNECTQYKASGTLWALYIH